MSTNIKLIHKETGQLVEVTIGFNYNLEEFPLEIVAYFNDKRMLCRYHSFELLAQEWEIPRRS